MSIIPRFFGGRKSNNTDPVSLDLWDPFDELSFAFLPTSAPEAASLADVRIDWKETPEAHIFTADIPGLNREEVKVEIEEGGILKISGVRSKEKEEKDTLWHRIERGVGNFLRRFRLPQNVKTDDVKANMDNGVLTVLVPKKEEKKPGVRTIEIA